MSIVLVTGGSGFVGSHAILQLLAAGHRVRTTIRDAAREPQVRAMLKAGGASPDAEVTFAIADLERDAGWRDAVDGCEYVLHVASPFPRQTPVQEDDLIRPAREGTIRVLQAARDAGVRRVVLTSSFAAIGYGHGSPAMTYTESDWTNVDGADVQPYIKSKTLAERAAWAFMTRNGGSLELSVVNPVGIFGPVLGSDYSASIAMIKQLMDGTMSAVPRLYFGVVDVRDVVDLHLRAMTNPAARGERFIATAGPAISFHDAAMILRRRLPRAAHRVPRWQLPNWSTRLLAHWVPAVRAAVPQLGIVRDASNAKARQKLQWVPRSAADSLVATAESLLDWGLLQR